MDAAEVGGGAGGAGTDGIVPVCAADAGGAATDRGAGWATLGFVPENEATPTTKASVVTTPMVAKSGTRFRGRPEAGDAGTGAGIAELR
jgi:hypothetical protein